MSNPKTAAQVYDAMMAFYGEEMRAAVKEPLLTPTGFFVPQSVENFAMQRARERGIALLEEWRSGGQS